MGDTPPLDVLGRFVVENVRDAAIGHFDWLCDPETTSPSHAGLRRELTFLPEEHRKVVRRAVVLSIDAAVHSVLFRLQEHADYRGVTEHLGDIEVRVRGEVVPQLGDQLHGMIYNEDGWYAKFSKYGEPTE